MRKPISKKRLIVTACILIALFGGSLLAFHMFTKKIDLEKQPVSVQKEVLVLFCPNVEGMLKKKSLEIDNDLSERAKAEMIIAELKKANAVPDALSVRDVATGSEGVVYLNLSHNIKNEEMSTAQGITALYSIINSLLSNFKNSKQVQLLVEGQVFHTVNGVLYTYDPIEFNNNIVEE
ncbi:MAG: GerMN domain-containing protein [Syntrophobacterales bacterium]|jgi:hypothetical protein|nr:GerMN domain-containing protein [Syntrophobacterales bacterium]